MWEISGFGESVLVPNLLGVKNLARLLQSPGEVVPWVDLVHDIRSGGHEPQPVLDSEALADIRRRRARLHEEITTAETEAERADSQRSLDLLQSQFTKDLGLSGRPRDLNNPIRNLRSKVHGRLKDVYLKIKSAPQLTNHFQTCISSQAGGYIYSPPSPLPQWQLEPPEEISR